MRLIHLGEFRQRGFALVTHPFNRRPTVFPPAIGYILGRKSQSLESEIKTPTIFDDPELHLIPALFLADERVALAE
jgi:hypothetical protein